MLGVVVIVLFLNRVKGFIVNRTPLVELYSKYYDFRHHCKYSFKEYKLKNERAVYSYYLRKSYHIVEKGLALPSPRMQFGMPRIIKLVELSGKYIRAYGEDELINSIKGTLVAYLDFHEAMSFELQNDFYVLLKDFVSDKRKGQTGGLKNLTRLESYEESFNRAQDLIKGRVSVRDFSAKEIPLSEIEKIIDLARYTPSVCNRQGWFVHVYSDKAKIQELLSYQNGNAGFNDSINRLLMVTGNAKAFTFSESNQLFIDGGLFSMNILLAIHAAGYGACPLNTCYPAYKEKKVKVIANIPDEERLIMMIGVGSLQEKYSVAYSNKFALENILIRHDV
jgi:nitroreductase